jgi:hypothetical protein
MDRAMCRHCGTEIVTRPRGLGWQCFADRSIRAKYPPACVYGRHGAKGHTDGTAAEPPLPPGPTSHRPGTPEKVLVMLWRVEQNLHLHHPNDPRIG